MTERTVYGQQRSKYFAPGIKQQTNKHRFSFFTPNHEISIIIITKPNHLTSNKISVNEKPKHTIISMAQRKTAVTPLLMQWSYHSLALSRRYCLILECRTNNAEQIMQTHSTEQVWDNYHRKQTRQRFNTLRLGTIWLTFCRQHLLLHFYFQIKFHWNILRVSLTIN